MSAGREYWENLGQYNIGYIGKMEKKMETTIMGYIGVISGSRGSGFYVRVFIAVLLRTIGTVGGVKLLSIMVP